MLRPKRLPDIFALGMHGHMHRLHWMCPWHSCCRCCAGHRAPGWTSTAYKPSTWCHSTSWTLLAMSRSWCVPYGRAWDNMTLQAAFPPPHGLAWCLLLLCTPVPAVKPFCGCARLQSFIGFTVGHAWAASLPLLPHHTASVALEYQPDL